MTNEYLCHCRHCSIRRNPGVNTNRLLHIQILVVKHADVFVIGLSYVPPEVSPEAPGDHPQSASQSTPPKHPLKEPLKVTPKAPFKARKGKYFTAQIRIGSNVPLPAVKGALKGALGGRFRGCFAGAIASIFCIERKLCATISPLKHGRLE